MPVCFLLHELPSEREAVANGCPMSSGPLTVSAGPGNLLALSAGEC